MIEDLLYEEIKPEGSKRTQTDKVTDNVEVVYEVTTTNGQDHYEIKSITITSTNTMTVTVDNKIIVQPPQPYQDDCCYFREKPMVSQPVPESYTFDRDELIKQAVAQTKFRVTHKEWIGPVRNNWAPSDFGYVGYKK